jgi:MbtH protein
MDPLKTQPHDVVRNHEEQYSVYPSELEVPPGWEPVGVRGTISECLEYIKATWMDITPASVRSRRQTTSRNEQARVDRS